VEHNLDTTTEHVPHPVVVLSEESATIMDPLFNAAGKAAHLDAVIVKQEAG
jgi:hypothetical protein